MGDGSDVLIIGGGLAGCTVAAHLARAGRAGDVTIIEGDPDAPYDRPPLTKTFLAESDALSRWPAWASKDVLWRRDRVKAIDLAERTVATEGGEHLQASNVVVTVGATARRLPGRPSRIVTIRTAADARVLRELVAAGARDFLIEGAGPLGLETASTFAAAGAAVTVIDPLPAPMMRMLGGHLAQDVASWADEAGVVLELNTVVRDVEVGPGSHGVTAAVGAGARRTFDAMVSAIGVEENPVPILGPHGPLGSPLVIDSDGRVLDEEGRPILGAFAAGDAVAIRHPDGTVVRSEAWTAAQIQGEAVARSLLGEPHQAAPTPYFWTRQFGRMIQLLGEVGSGTELHVCGEVPKVGGVLYRVTRDGATTGFLGVNAQRLVAQLQVQGGRIQDWKAEGETILTSSTRGPDGARHSTPGMRRTE